MKFRVKDSNGKRRTIVHPDQTTLVDQWTRLPYGLKVPQKRRRFDVWSFGLFLVMVAAGVYLWVW